MPLDAIMDGALGILNGGKKKQEAPENAGPSIDNGFGAGSQGKPFEVAQRKPTESPEDMLAKERDEINMAAANIADKSNAENVGAVGADLEDTTARGRAGAGIPGIFPHEESPE